MYIVGLRSRRGFVTPFWFAQFNDEYNRADDDYNEGAVRNKNVVDRERDLHHLLSIIRENQPNDGLKSRASTSNRNKRIFSGTQCIGRPGDVEGGGGQVPADALFAGPPGGLSLF